MVFENSTAISPKAFPVPRSSGASFGKRLVTRFPIAFSSKGNRSLPAASLSFLNSPFKLTMYLTKLWASGDRSFRASAKASAPLPPFWVSFKSSLASLTARRASAICLFISRTALLFVGSLRASFLANSAAVSALVTSAIAFAASIRASASPSVALRIASFASLTAWEPSTPAAVAAFSSFFRSLLRSIALRRLRSASANASSASWRAREFGGRSWTRCSESRAFSNSRRAFFSEIAPPSTSKRSCWIFSLASSGNICLWS